MQPTWLGMVLKWPEAGRSREGARNTGFMIPRPGEKGR